MLKQRAARRADLGRSPRPRARRICCACRVACGIGEALTDILVGAATARSRAASPPTAGASCRRTRSPRWSSAPSATTCWPRRSACAPIFRRACSAAAHAGDRRGATAAAGAGQAGNPGRNPPRAGQGDRRGRRQGRAAQLHRGARGGARAAQGAASSTEAEVADYAKTGKYEETIAALATLCAVPVEVVDRLMSGERADPVLILARAAGFGWPTVRAIMLRGRGQKPSRQVLDAAREFRAADRGHRPARRALLAGAASASGMWPRVLTRSGCSDVRTFVPEVVENKARRRALRAWPWPRSACRKNPARACASRRRAPRSRRNRPSAARALSV